MRCEVRNALGMPPPPHRALLREGLLKQARVDRLRGAVLARFAGALLIGRAADTRMGICARLAFLKCVTPRGTARREQAHRER